MKQWFSKLRSREIKGQSLVEIALFLPIFIIVIAGIVEVSNLLVTQNRVTTASRIATGFGATNFSEDEWADYDPDLDECNGGTACSMGAVAINTVTETLDLSEDVWDVWSINARFNSAGTDFEVFTHTHSYGDFQVISESEWDALIPGVRQDMINALDITDGMTDTTDTQGLEVVSTIAYHDIGTILGIPVWQWTGLQTIRGLTVMRVDEKPPFLGCPILPIAIRFDQYSLYPTDWEEMGGLNLRDDGVPIETFPPEFGKNGQIEWDYPVGAESELADGSVITVPIPTYTQMVSPALTTLYPSNFTENVPAVHFLDAQPGYLYWARDIKKSDDPIEYDLSGNFGWLSWRDDSSEGALDASLRPPSGNFVDPDLTDGIEVGYAGGPMDLGTANKCPGPGEEIGDGDAHLAIDEWISIGPGNINSGDIREHLQYYVDNKIVVFLLVFDYSNLKDDPYNPTSCEIGGGSNAYYHVAEFAKVRLVGWKYTATEKWLVIEFIDWGFECHKPDN